MDSVASSIPARGLDGRPLRALGMFAPPDDETVCAGGTLAKYASAGADVRLVALTNGGACETRDASVATRATWREAREREVVAAGKELGLAETTCRDYPDQGLPEIDSRILIELVSELLGDFDPGVVITFGPD